MPHQNRVTPFSEVIATPERGQWYGNRGCLHDAAGRLRRDHATTRWIFCELQFKGRWRPVMTPGHYTGLFFLDEATALAAGHRPCAECMRTRYNTFRAAWAAANPGLCASARPSATALDAALHAERWRPEGGRRRYTAAVADLPRGAMVAMGDAAYLVWDAALWLWSPGGYARPNEAMPAEAQVLTPPSVVRALAGGYMAQVHASCTAGGG